MAIYEFGCGSCEVIIEKRQTFHDPLPTCCGKEMERLISMPAAPVFHGPGTYATDYGNMAHHLKPLDQRKRARVECYNRELKVATPGLTNPNQEKEIKKLSERGKYV